LLPKLVNLVFAVLALLLVLLSFLKPWFALPHITIDTDQYFTTDSFLTIFFKLLLLLASGGAVLSFLLSKRLRSLKWILQYCLVCLTLVALYPTALILLDVKSAGDAAWLQQQHDTLTWLGGDIYRAHSERSVESGTGVLAQDPPERLAVFRPPTGSFGIDRLNDWIWWLGYGPSWTQFAGKGWFYAVIGYLLLILCIIGYYWRYDIAEARSVLRSGLKRIIVMGAPILVIVGIYYAYNKHLLRSAENATAEGDYEQAETYLARSAKLMPALLNDSGFIRQQGYTHWQLGKNDTPEAQLYQVFWFDANGYHDRAGALMKSLANTELPRHVERELSRHFLRVAVNDFNSGKLSQSIDYLAQLLSLEPNCLQAHFHTQLVNLQAQNLVATQHANERVHTLYYGFKSKNKRGVLATSDWLLAQAELAAGNTEAAWAARRKSKGGK